MKTISRLITNEHLLFLLNVLFCPSNITKPKENSIYNHLKQEKTADPHIQSRGTEEYFIIFTFYVGLSIDHLNSPFKDLTVDQRGKVQTDKNAADDSDSVPLDPNSGRAAPARLSELLCGLVF